MSRSVNRSHPPALQGVKSLCLVGVISIVMLSHKAIGEANTQPTAKGHFSVPVYLG